MKKGFKKCPFCANEIKEGAIKCPFCEEFLDGRREKEENNTSKSNNKLPIILSIIIGILVLFFIIYLIFNKNNNEENETTNIVSDNISSEIIEKTDNNKVEDNKTKTKKSGWNTYDDGMITFEYPSTLIIADEKNPEDKGPKTNFFNTFNIKVTKYDYESYLKELRGDMGVRVVDLNEKEVEDYERQSDLSHRTSLDSIKNGKWDGGKLCTYGACSVTAGVIGTKEVTINGIHGIINNYYFTQDPGLACFTSIQTEVLLVKDENTIYSLLFNYNFADAYTFLYKYKDNFNGSLCFYNIYPKLSSEWNDLVEGFFRYEKSTLIGTDVEAFEKTYNMMMEIVNTINIKDKATKGNNDNINANNIRESSLGVSTDKECYELLEGYLNRGAITDIYTRKNIREYNPQAFYSPRLDACLATYSWWVDQRDNFMYRWHIVDFTDLGNKQVFYNFITESHDSLRGGLSYYNELRDFEHENWEKMSVAEVEEEFETELNYWRGKSDLPNNLK